MNTVVENPHTTSSKLSGFQGSRLKPLLAILAVISLGAIWRILYVVDVSPFVDEYITMQAATKILAHGYPLLASGNIYTHGIAHSYLVAGAFALLGRTETAARLPGLLISLFTLLLVWFIGRRMFGRRAALLASLLLALDPAAIIWGGRARMYAFQQLCVLLAFYWLYRSDIAAEPANDGTGYRFAFALAYAVAVFNQGITALLLPVMVLLVLWRRGIRGMLRWQVIFPFALAATSIGVVWKLDRVGLPAMTMVAPFVFVTRHRPTFQLALDGPGTVKVIAPYTQLPYAPLTALFILGVAWYVVRALQSGYRTWSLSSATTYGYVIILSTVLEIFLIIGHTWKSPRFLFMLLPIFYFLVATIFVRGLDWMMVSGSTVQRIIFGILVLAILITYLPAAHRAAQTRVWGYDRAFRWLRTQRQAGDVVLTVNAPACAFVLHSCDYVAVEKGFEGYALQDAQGRWVGGWDLTPLLTSSEQLDAVLDAAPTTWFVVDKRRLHEKYTPTFVNLVQQRMNLVYQYRGAFVFRSR